MAFTHNGIRCTVYPTPGAPGRWSVRADGGPGPLVTRRPTIAKATSDAKALMDGDSSRVTGFDMLAHLLTL
jgi:hypothetical protein